MPSAVDAPLAGPGFRGTVYIPIPTPQGRKSPARMTRIVTQTHSHSYRYLVPVLGSQVENS